MGPDPRWTWLRRARVFIAGFALLAMALVVAQWFGELYLINNAVESTYDRRYGNNWHPVISSMPFCLVSWLLPTSMVVAGYLAGRIPKQSETTQEQLDQSVSAARAALWMWRIGVGVFLVFLLGIPCGFGLSALD